MQLKDRPRGAVLAAAGLAALVVVLVATPDNGAFVFGAWLLVLAGVAAVALGMAAGFRHQARLEEEHEPLVYLTADWVEGAQVFTVGDRAEPPSPEPTPDPFVESEPASDPELPPSVLPHAPDEPELEPAGRARSWTASPRVAAALVVASGLREILRPTRATQ